MSRSSTRVGDARAPRSFLDRIKAVPQDAQRRLEHLRSRSGAADVAVRTFKRYSEDDCGSYAAAITYYTFFAFFPLLLFAAAAIGYLTFGNDDLAEKVVRNGVDAIPVVRHALTEDGLDELQKNKDAIAGAGLVLALYAGTGMIVALQHSLNRIERIEDEGSWFQKRGRALRWLAVLGIAGLVSLGLTTVAEAVTGVAGSALGYAGAFLIDVGLIATAFRYLPAIRRSWRDVFAGAICAAVAFSLLKASGAAYLARGEAARDETYGALAGAATLLVASYLISQVALLAAEVNATLIERRAVRTKATDRAKETA